MPHPATASLLLVPNTLDLGEPEAQQADIRQVLPDGVLQRVAALTDWVAEDAKTTRAFLQRVSRVYPLTVPLQAIHCHLASSAQGRWCQRRCADLFLCLSG